MPPTPTGPNAPTASTVPTHARFWVIVFAVSLAVIQYIDRVCISQAAPLISSDLHLTPSQMGLVFSAFTLAYALFEIPGGYLGDRIGPRRVLLRIVVWWSFFTAATGWAWNLVSLVTTRFLFGAGEAGCFPNLTKAFNRWLPQRERSRAQGIMWMSARWGGAAAPMLVMVCLQWMSWRAAFAVFGVIGVAWAILFYRWFRDDPRTHPSVNAAEAALLPAADEQGGAHFRVPWSKLVRSRTVWCLCGQYAALSFSWYFFITWYPTYLLQARGFDMKQSALLAATPLLLGGCGSFFAGWITPHLGRWLGSVGRARCTLGVTGFLIAGVLILVSINLENPYAAVAAIAAASFFNDITIPGAWTSCMDVGGRFVGTLGGSMNMLGNFGGALSPWVAAKIVETTHQWTWAFYVFSGAYFLGAIFWLLMDPVTPLEQQVKD
jgi:MFS family permease